MPLYEYQCEACQHRFEKIQKFTDPPPDACPKCGGAVRKLFSSPAIQFKGTGWYITDYAKKPPADGGQPGASDKDKKEEKKGGSESKAEKGDSAPAKSESRPSKSDSGSKTDSGSSSSSAPAPAAKSKDKE